MIIDPTSCKQKVLDLYGAAGAAWLERLPALIAECAERWSVTIEQPFPYNSYSYVTAARRADGEPVVLKVGVPNAEFTCQIEALKIWGGDGICRLQEADAEKGIMLLERVLPGTALEEVTDEEQAAQAAVSVMRALWKPAPAQHKFLTVASWGDDFKKLRSHFDGTTGPFPQDLIERAEGLFRELLVGSPPMLIHGDVNPVNILRSDGCPERRALQTHWLAIDPKGWVGDPLFDAATYINGLEPDRPEAELRRLLARRMDIVTGGLGADRQRVEAWGFCHRVLAAYWTWEDHQGRGWEPGMAFARLYLK